MSIPDTTFRFLTILLVGFLLPANRGSSREAYADSKSSKQPVEVVRKRIKGIDLDGQLHRIADRSSTRAIVFVFLSTGCPVSNSYVPRLNAIAKRQDKNTEFYGVISDSATTRKLAIRHRKKFNVQFPVLFDASGELRRTLRPTHVPQAIVLDHNQRVVYSGLIDDWYAELGSKRVKTTRFYLEDGIEAALREQAPAVKRTTPIGCLIEDDDGRIESSSVTFCRDIAPIMIANCVDCHREGETAPFPLISYKDVSKRAKQIAAVTKSRFMPPWKPKPGFGHFRGERRLSKRQIALIAAWANGGKALGDPDDLPPQPKFPGGWRLGKPDLVLKMAKPYDLPAGGDDVFRHFVIPTNVSQNRLVAAWEFKAGNPRVAHHASIFFDNTGDARLLDAEGPGYGYSRFGGTGFVACASLGNWLPGSVPQKLPQGTGRMMPRGSDLVLQMHYQCTGKAESDQSTIGIYFADRSARQVISEFQVLNCNLKVPAGARRHHHRAVYRLPADVYILDAAPHMHLLGREMKVTAHLPNGKTVPVIWIEDWDFNWQGQYTFRKPLHFPKGTQITVDAWLDNSSKNPLNPNSPPKDAYWGEQTNDEMPLCQFRYTTRTAREFVTVERHYYRLLKTQYKAHYDRAGIRTSRLDAE